MINCGPCYKCKCEMWLPDDLYRAAKCSEKITVYCAYGHGQIFKQGETEEQKLRRERDRLAQRVAQRDDEIARQRELREAAERSAAAYKGQTTKLKKRAKAGTCPCCNRTFSNMAEHMRKQHPDFGPDDSNVVKLKTA